jgi:hypothetical protein
MARSVWAGKVAREYEDRVFVSAEKLSVSRTAAMASSSIRMLILAT